MPIGKSLWNTGEGCPTSTRTLDNATAEHLRAGGPPPKLTTLNLTFKISAAAMSKAGASEEGTDWAGLYRDEDPETYRTFTQGWGLTEAELNAMW